MSWPLCSMNALASLGMVPGSVVAQVRVAADRTAADQLVSEGSGRRLLLPDAAGRCPAVAAGGG